MVRGGTIIDIVAVSESHLWVNVAGSATVWLDTTMVVLVDPQGMTLEVGDGLWWLPESNVVYWTPRSIDDKRVNVQLPKLDGTLRHPHLKPFNTVRAK